MQQGIAIRGAEVGLLGALILTGADRLERRLLGRSAIYAPPTIARRLFGRRGAREQSRFASLHGFALRAAYSAALGALYGALRERFPRRRTIAGITLGAEIWVFELVALPALGVVPPLRDWPPTELALLLAHTLVFGISTGLIFDQTGRWTGSRVEAA
jgi:uncharacterized membrane protein YagU involved in acid resistance